MSGYHIRDKGAYADVNYAV